MHTNYVYIHTYFTIRLLQKLCPLLCTDCYVFCMCRLLGEGAFGEVIAGTLQLPDEPEPVPVAIKVSSKVMHTECFHFTLILRKYSGNDV